MTEQEYAHRAEEVKTALYRAAYVYLGSADAALEAVDEAIYRGFLSHRKLREPEHFKTWLTRILINVCVNELRRRKRFTGQEDLPEGQTTELDYLPLRDAVEKLPEELRAVVTLRFFSGLTLSETAEVLGLPVGTVSTRQRRALALLRLDLE